MYESAGWKKTSSGFFQTLQTYSSNEILKILIFQGHLWKDNFLLFREYHE